MKIKLTKKQWLGLGYGRIKSDREKGDVIEYITKEVLLQLGADEVYNNKDLEDQIRKGDLVVIKDNKEILVEVKSSHIFRKTNKDKLALDYKYYKKGSNCRVMYTQSTTNSHLGWLYFTQADWLITYNADSNKMYIIKDYQELKENIIKEVEKYEKDLKYGSYTWYLKNWNNRIHKFLEGGVKIDTCKESLIVNLELSKQAIEEFNSKCKIIDVIIEVERQENDNKKILPAYQSKSISRKRI